MHPLEYSYSFNMQIIKQYFSDFNEDEMVYSLQRNNEIGWEFGHIVLCRFMIKQMLGQSVEDIGKWKECFDIGSNGLWSDKNLKKIDLDEAIEAIEISLDDKAVESLEKPMKHFIANEEKTLFDNILFMFWHESHHLGKISCARKALGKKGLA